VDDGDKPVTETNDTGIDGLVEMLARGLVVRRGAKLLASDEHWTHEVEHYHEMNRKHPGSYANGGTTTADAFRDARACVEMLLERNPSVLLGALRRNTGPVEAKRVGVTDVYRFLSIGETTRATDEEVDAASTGWTDIGFGSEGRTIAQGMKPVRRRVEIWAG
jgi:hypothetical protein